MSAVGKHLRKSHIVARSRYHSVASRKKRRLDSGLQHQRRIPAVIAACLRLGNSVLLVERDIPPAVCHPQWRENALPYELVERLARYDFDHAPKHVRCM